jgi:hypothetical protein
MCVVWVELKREVVSGVRDARAVKRRSTEAETRRRRGLEEVRKQRLESEARPGPVRLGVRLLAQATAPTQPARRSARHAACLCLVVASHAGAPLNTKRAEARKGLAYNGGEALL